MNQRSTLIELTPNRLLLDHSFGGYKLSLDSIPVYRKKIETGVKVIQPGDNQYSFYHVKIFSLHNHLHVNFYKPDSVYYVDKNWKVCKVTSSFPGQAILLKEVFQIPNVQNQELESYNVSLAFPSSNLVVISDGKGALYLAAVEKQEDNEIWELLYSDCLVRETIGCILSDARVELINDKITLNVLFLFIKEKGNENKHSKGSLFQTNLNWRTFFKEFNIWKKGGNKELCVSGSVDYAALEPGCKSLYLICDKSPKWVYDSENLIKSDASMLVEPEFKPKSYTWTQTDKELTIWLPLPEKIKKSDLSISVDNLELDVRIKDRSFISGKFFRRVIKDLTTWSFEKDGVEIQLTKHESGLMWKILILDDKRGEEILDPEVVQNVHEKLAHLCSDKQETSFIPSFNSQQLEECDAAICDTTSLFRINGESHLTTHEVSLSSLQWLFKVSCDPNQTPAICVRHDVDACVWQFSRAADEETWAYEHVGTFSAFGYVQASKTQKKFVAAPQNLSYVAICEASHHIYIYRQRTALTSELKNRHTGKKIATISKQQLVNLETKDEILGVHATNNLLFVLLENSVCVLAVNS